jgi:1-deoxy-D-xylulose-5-phosphate reductoisomerase
MMNAANEAAVNAFLDGRIGYTDIAKTVQRALQTIPYTAHPTLQDLLDTHAETLRACHC